MNILGAPLAQYTGDAIAAQNAATSAFARKVFTVAGTSVFLRPQEASANPKAAVKCLFLGQEFTLLVDVALIDTLLSSFNLRLQEMSEDAIALFLLTHVDKMPKNIQVLSICLEHQHIDSLVFDLIAYEGNTPTGWQIGFALPEGFALPALVDALAPYLQGVMASVLEPLPITVPLVACTLSVEADLIGQLGVGDVLLLGAQ